jgi:hypothetical protein
MKQRPRIYYSETQKAMMWERWKQGESLHQIAQLFDRHHSSIRGILAEAGGIRPAQRHHSPVALTLAEREEISRSLVVAQDGSHEYEKYLMQESIVMSGLVEKVPFISCSLPILAGMRHRHIAPPSSVAGRHVFPAHGPGFAVSRRENRYGVSPIALI